MRVLMINSVCGIRSTGRICTDLAKGFLDEGHDVKIAYGRESVPEEYRSLAVRIGNEKTVYKNALKARLLDNEGFNCRKTTETFLEWADEYNPDILWMHNLHGYYVNVEMLFDWIKARQNMQVKWTLHDCWAFTGHCSHFSYVKCSKWKTGCSDCSQKRSYPSSACRDNSAANYARKKKVFCGVENMNIIVPSHWLAELVKQSYLKDYQVEVVYNTIDTTVFKPTTSKFREKNGLQDKKIVLGVATAWSERKGLFDLVQLSDLLDESYQIVLVGLTDKQMKQIPKKIVCFPRTNSKEELAQIYSAADVFVNPSKEETFSLTTVESLACGTPAIVYKDTACEEVARRWNGMVVAQSVSALKTAVEECVAGVSGG